MPLPLPVVCCGMVFRQKFFCVKICKLYFAKTFSITYLSLSHEYFVPMGSRKLASLLKVAFGGGLCFAGVNIYYGDDRLYSRFLMPMVHTLYQNAEHSHILAVKAARYGLVPRIKDDAEIKPLLKTNLWDIDFDNPVGLAAGFDKNGEAINGLSHLGFGFIEVGSITPLPQQGNPYPRVFRLPQDNSIINRYGFNNLGHDEMSSNLARQESIIKERNVIVGVNLGKNKTTESAYSDYVVGLRKFHHLDTIKYFVINISSPNTPNLRKLQNQNEFNELLDQVLREKLTLEKRDRVHKPLLIKLAPDLNDDQVKNIADTIRRYNRTSATHSKVDGLIISNTTVSRPTTLKSSPRLVIESGGLSGPPLRQPSIELIRKMYKLTNGSVPIIGVGGIENGMDAFEKIAAGASLVQLYTSMAYFGPQIVREIKKELAQILSFYGFDNIQQAVGCEEKLKLIKAKQNSNDK